MMPDNTAPIIYVVDDDDMVRDSLRALLESRRFRVIDFESGVAFLGHADGMHTSCLVLDINMPEMTGIEVLRRLRKQGRTIPTILITGRTDTTARAEAEALGAVALLDKPIAYLELFSAIERALAATAH